MDMHSGGADRLFQQDCQVYPGCKNGQAHDGESRAGLEQAGERDRAEHDQNAQCRKNAKKME